MNFLKVNDFSFQKIKVQNIICEFFQIVYQIFITGFDEGEKISNKVFYTLVIIYGVVISLGLIGNLVILYAILSKRHSIYIRIVSLLTPEISTTDH